MRAGRLNTRVDIRQRVTANNTGAISNTYPSSASRGTRWMERRGLSAVEQFRSQQLDADIDVVFNMRSDSVTRAILPTDRFLVGATSGTHNWYDIRPAIDPDGRRKQITVFGTERHVG